MQGIRVLATYNCNIICSDCRYKCGPYRRGIMDPDVFRYKVTKSYFSGYKDYILITGGELFNKSAVLYKYLKKINDINIKKYVKTNGFWGETEPYMDILKDLKHKGLNGIIIEYDSRKAAYINISTIKKAIEKCKYNNLETIVIANFTTMDIECKEDEQTMEYIKELKAYDKSIRFHLFSDKKKNSYFNKVLSLKEDLILF